MAQTQIPAVQIKDNDIKNVDIASNAAIAFSKLAGVAASSHVHATADITTGTFDNARIAVGNVTQHVAAIDHDALSNFVTQEHIRWDLTGTGTIHSTNYTDTVYSHPNHSGDVTSVGDGAQTIVADAVTYAKMQNVVADDRILGNIGGAGGVITELTATQVRTMIDTLYTADGFLVGRTTTTPDTVGDSAGITLNYLGSGASPKPSGTDFSMITMAYSAAWQTQMAADWREGGRLFIRGQENTVWTNWKQVWSEIDFANNSGNWDTAYGWGDHGEVIHDNVAAEIFAIPNKTVLDPLDVLILEDEGSGYDKARVTFAQIEASLDHANITNIGSNSHATIDTHLGSTSNPHSVTKAQVVLGNVIDVLQLKNVNNTWATELTAAKSTPSASDKFIMEDSDSQGDKVYATYANLETQMNHDNLRNYDVKEHINWTADAGSNNIHVNNITAVPEAAVTAHEAAIRITESQISDFGAYLLLTGGTLSGDLQVNGTIRQHALSNDPFSGDCNILDVDGFRVDYLTTSATNKPPGTNHACITTSFGITYTVQYATDWRTEIMYIRTQNNGTWGGWKKMYSEVNESEIDHDGLANFVSDEHLDWTTSQGGMRLVHNDNINGTTESFSILDGSGMFNHDFVFANGVLTSYGTSSS